MAKYLFYTSEGWTQAPDNTDVENYQILGFVQEDDEPKALRQLLNDNPWITEHQYDIDTIQVVQVI